MQDALQLVLGMLPQELHKDPLYCVLSGRGRAHLSILW